MHTNTATAAPVLSHLGPEGRAYARTAYLMLDRHLSTEDVALVDEISTAFSAVAKVRDEETRLTALRAVIAAQDTAATAETSRVLSRVRQLLASA